MNKEWQPMPGDEFTVTPNGATCYPDETQVYKCTNNDKGAIHSTHTDKSLGKMFNRCDFTFATNKFHFHQVKS